MITTLDGIVAGMQTQRPFLKTGIGMAAVGAIRAYNPRYATGNPGTATAPTPGVNGAAVTGPGSQIFRVNPSTGFAYVAGVDMAATTSGTLWLIDRMWENSGLSTTLTTSQAITPAALPARDNDGLTDGTGVYAAIEWSVVGGAGTPTATLTYTNEDGITARTATLASVATPPVGTFEIFTPQQVFGGVRAPTAFIWSATHTSGTFHLVLFRKLLSVSCPLANVQGMVDSISGRFPRVYDNSNLEFVWFSTSTTAVNLFGGYTETHG